MMIPEAGYLTVSPTSGNIFSDFTISVDSFLFNEPLHYRYGVLSNNAFDVLAHG
jgi:hypothetical protein